MNTDHIAKNIIQITRIGYYEQQVEAISNMLTKLLKATPTSPNPQAVSKGTSSSFQDFETKRNALVDDMYKLIRRYELLTNEVSPSKWRLTGHHITTLHNIAKEMDSLKQITPEEKEIPWVKEALK